MNGDFCRKIAGTMILHSFGPEIDDFDVLELEFPETFCRDILDAIQIEEFRKRITDAVTNDQGVVFPIHQALWLSSPKDDCYKLKIVFQVSESDIDISYQVEERGLFPENYGNWNLEQWYEE